jgi:hypothetical protein
LDANKLDNLFFGVPYDCYGEYRFEEFVPNVFDFHILEVDGF